jgi:hypothetical protein
MPDKFFLTKPISTHFYIGLTAPNEGGIRVTVRRNANLCRPLKFRFVQLFFLPLATPMHPPDGAVPSDIETREQAAPISAG